jgi:HK97 family phage portal protein
MRLWPFSFSLELKSLSSPTSDELAMFTGITPGSGLSSARALSNTAVASAVRTISEAAASLDLNLVKGGKDGTLVDAHPALDLLRGHVNDWTSGYELIRDLIVAALTRDIGGLAWVNRINDEPREIIVYESGVIDVDMSRLTGEPVYRLSTRPIPSSDIIHVRGPFNKCPVTLACEAIAAAIVMESHASKLFKNGARPGGVIEYPKSIGDEALKKMRSAWKAAHEGEDNAGKTAILWDGAQFKAMQLASTDAQFLENRRFQIEEIGRAFGIPVSMIGDLTKSSYANAEQKAKEFLSYCLEPWLRVVESAFNRALLNDQERAELTFRFDRDDLTRASLTERATAINSLIASETINPNTGRDWLGLPPYDGGDKYGNRNINVQQPARQENSNAA